MAGLGIDLGTANTVVCHGESGVVFNEPSVMAFRLNGSRPRFLGLGSRAHDLIGRVPTGVAVVRPVEDGVVSDLEATRRFLVEVLREVAADWWVKRRAPVVIGVPAGATTLERRALLEAAEEAKIGRPVLVPEPIAGMIGAGVDPLDPGTHMVVDVGGGTSEVAVFGYGGLLSFRSCPLAGEEMTLAVYQHLRERHQLLVGKLVAEDVKRAASRAGKGTLVVHGQDAATGRGRAVTIPVDEIVEATRHVTDTILQTLSSCLEDLPAQCVSDVMDEGVVAVGGGSLLPGFDARLEEALGFSVKVAERPLTCVAEGMAQCAGQPEALAAYAVH